LLVPRAHELTPPLNSNDHILRAVWCLEQSYQSTSFFGL
jgi:hypothetical protein